MKFEGPRDSTYVVPPCTRLHYALLRVSSRTYCVIEYDSKVGIPPSDVFPAVPYQEACQKWQHGYCFRIVSKPMSHMLATDCMMHLISKRLKDRPIILSDEVKS